MVSLAWFNDVIAYLHRGFLTHACDSKQGAIELFHFFAFSRFQIAFGILVANGYTVIDYWSRCL